MGCYNNWRQSVWVHEEKVERKKESLELEHPWRGNSEACWSVSGAYLELRTKEPRSQA
jgi:hypothetical protein